MVDTFLFLQTSPDWNQTYQNVRLQILEFSKGLERGSICCMRCVDLKNDTLKILRTDFSYNEKLREDINFCTTATNIQQVLEIWTMRNLTLEGKMVIFKTLAISKVAFQSLITTVPRHIVNELEKMQKTFLWKNSSPKIKHETLCNNYKGGGSKNIDILNKIISLQCSWIRRLYNNSFHEWKLIPLFLIKKSFESPFKFHSNFFLWEIKSSFFHLSTGKFVLYWKEYLTRKPELQSCILSQYLWYNENILVDKNSIYVVPFSEKNGNYVSRLFQPDGFI